MVGYESCCLGACTVDTRVLMFTVLAWNGVKLEWSVGKTFFITIFVYIDDVPVLEWSL